jgi:Ca2+/Na+ antiporter
MEKQLRSTIFNPLAMLAGMICLIVTVIYGLYFQQLLAAMLIMFLYLTVVYVFALIKHGHDVKEPNKVDPLYIVIGFVLCVVDIFIYTQVAEMAKMAFE